MSSQVATGALEVFYLVDAADQDARVATGALEVVYLVDAADQYARGTTGALEIFYDATAVAPPAPVAAAGGWNLPATTAANISFGPARLYMGPVGSTPTVDVGAIGEDGLRVEIMQELRDLQQGNPGTGPEVEWAALAGLRLRVTSIEWDLDNLALALATGTTSAPSGGEALGYGGGPCPAEVALMVEHQLCSGVTMFVDVWRAVGDGNIPLAQGGDGEHRFAESWRGLRSATAWGGAALPRDRQLLRIRRVG